MMEELGLKQVWDRGNLGGMALETWKELIKAKIREWEEERWKRGIEGKTKLRNYKRWKTRSGREDYLTDGNDTAGTRMVTKLRGGANPLRIDQGRKEGIPREERICQICENGVEDEEHFMLRCARYGWLRAKLRLTVNRALNYVREWWDDETRGPELMDILLGEAAGKKRGTIVEAVKRFAAQATITRAKTLRLRA